MSLLINIENYEAFYLDFLEGNLNEDENRAFLTFLEENPDLIQDEDLMSFSAENPLESLDNNFIKNLKVFDKSETISAENYENFMIASVEKQLGVTKQTELKDFITKHKKLQEEYNLYQKAILFPDTTIVYAEKNKLKRGIVIPLYGKFISIAAALAIIFFAIPTNNPNLSSGELVASRRILNENPLKNKKIDLIPSDKTNTNLSFDLKNSTSAKIIKKEENLLPSENIDVNSIALIEMKTRKINIEIPSKNSNFEIIPSDFASTFEKNKKTLKNSVAEESSYLAFSEMKNPAKIVTNTVAEKFKTKVDLRTAKASSKKQGGFFIKIGKFELSRKTAPQDILAAN